MKVVKEYYNKFNIWFRSHDLKDRVRLRILAIISLIIWDLIYAHFCLTLFGGYPVAGFTGVIIVCFTCFITIDVLQTNKDNDERNDKSKKKKKKKTKNERRKEIMQDIFLTLLPFASALFYAEFYNDFYTEMLRKTYLKESHIEHGKVYKIYRRTGKGESGYAVIVGIDEKHTMKHRIYENYIAENMSVGDDVLLKVSDRYPRVNEIIECNGIKLKEGDDYSRVNKNEINNIKDKIEINDIKLE